MEVHQILPTLWYGDAIGNHTLALRNQLRAWGITSDIFADRFHPRMAGEGRHFTEYGPRPDTVTIYHYSFAHDEVSGLFLRCPGKKVLIYHNITPHEFFARYNPGFYEFTKKAREGLGDFREVVDVALGDSPYNCAELTAVGYRNPRVLPLQLDLTPFATTEPCRHTLPPLCDGWVNFLFVGRFVPNKRQDDVIRAFAHYHHYINRRSRLLLVGGTCGLEKYVEECLQTAEALGVRRRIVMAPDVEFHELAAYYRAAHVFLCLSEHEGFCVPLLEAMWHGIPVIAYHSTAVPYTMGKAGVLIREKDCPTIAEMAHLLLSDGGLRDRVIRVQKERLADFAPEVVAGRLRGYLAEAMAA
jgi:glycosyltransferase involved in cell wall biosynthesis